MPLRRFPVGKDSALFFPPNVVLLARGHKRHANDLADACDKTLIEQLRRYVAEQRFLTDLAYAVPEGPHRRSVWTVRSAGQTTEALVAHTVEQLAFHLLIRPIVQALEYHDAHQRLGRVRWSTAPCAQRTRRNLIDLCRQYRKVVVQLDLGERIAERVDFLRSCSSANRSV